MKTVTAAVCTVLALAHPAGAQTPQGTAFTYQGRLTDAGTPAEGVYDVQLRLYDAPPGGAQSGPTVVRDDVPVTDGLFTVTLDFGAVFAGSKRFLDIAVRPGASTGAFASLSPRQELTSGPASLWSAAAPWSGVSGKPAGFADDTDDDALGALSCGGGQVAKWNGAAWACAADANSGGTVTSVATGAGLTGGPVTGAGTLAVANGGITTALLANQAVTSPKIASGAVGLAQINTAQVQARIGGSCPAGQYLRGINADGSVVCEPVFAPGSVATVDDPANLVGQHTSIATGGDGLPVISYHDATGGALKVAKCGNAFCTVSTRTFVDDPAVNVVGLGSSVAIGADGLPVISYNDSTAGTLKVAHCGNLACSAGNIVTTVDDPPAPSTFAGTGSSITIGADGLPVVSYREQFATTLSLKVAKCANAACTGSATVTSLSSDLGSSGDIAVGSDGLPIVSFYSAGIVGLRVAKCGNASCSAGNVLTSLDSPGAGGGYLGFDSSVAIGSDGLPVISYATSLGALKVAKCSTPSCR